MTAWARCAHPPGLGMGGAKREWEEYQERGWAAPDDKYVCEKCVEDKYLKNIINENVDEKHCDYCGWCSQNAIAAPVEVILEKIASALYYYFCEPTNAGVPWDSGWVIEPTYTEDALMGLPLECHDDLFADIADSFSNDAWVPAADGHWASAHDNQVLLGSWNDFANTIKHDTRYFFDVGTGSTVTDPQGYEPRYMLPAIAKVVTDNLLVKVMPTGRRFFRVRERHRRVAWDPNAETMGAPPSDLAKAGRMNPAGISYLYLAFDNATALAEMIQSPPVEVVIAEFELSKDIRVLDLYDLPPQPSLFDANHRELREGLIFLDKFIEEISKPVRKDGREHVDYVPSQVVCEYFARAFHIGNESAPLDGIIYPSAIRKGGRNLVLFPTERGYRREFASVTFVGAFELSLNDWDEVASEIVSARRAQ